MPAMLRSEPFGFASALTTPIVFAVHESDATILFELVHHCLGGLITALAVRDGKAQHAADLRRERAVGLDLHVDVAALEAEVRVLRERAGQEPAFGQDLEAVADAEHVPAALDMLGDGAHDRADVRDRAATQVVAVPEAAGDRDEVGAGR